MKKALALLIMAMMILICSARDNIVTATIQDTVLEVTFAIPEGMHQTLQEDYFFVDVDSVSGVTFEPTVYPEGHPDADGYINYEGTVTLTKKFSIAESIDPATISITLWAGYQLCFPSYCEPPAEVEISLSLAPQTKDATPLESHYETN
ncbi:MAG: hypothetical protein J7K89_07610 [Candidatus Cloacimonetes bacterium]|nr:hypothetical protein [Candidatus Cloacimonadota bacterium]